MIRKDAANADTLVRDMGPEEREKLAALCRRIRVAEQEMVEAAAASMENCYSGCRGLCCRNVELESIISSTDLVFLMAEAPEMRDTLFTCLEHEVPHTADCVFLKDGKGPCILPIDVRPKVCLITFCADDSPIALEIREIERAFRRLWFFLLKYKLQKFRLLG
jgi:hypothetical protein